MRRRDTFGFGGGADLPYGPETVTTSCSECGASVQAHEHAAAEKVRGFRAITCDRCEHDCLDHFDEGRNDPLTPPHIVDYECKVCGERWEFNTRTAEHEVME